MDALEVSFLGRVLPRPLYRVIASGRAIGQRPWATRKVRLVSNERANHGISRGGIFLMKTDGGREISMVKVEGFCLGWLG